MRQFDRAFWIIRGCVVKASAKIIRADTDKNTITVKLLDAGKTKFLKENNVRFLDIIVDPHKKHMIRKKVFSLIGFLWDNDIYEIFGDLSDPLRLAIDKIKYYKGYEYARDMYRYNIYLQLGFTSMTMGLFPDNEGGFIRRFGEMARSLSDESGVTYKDLSDFYHKLEYLVIYYCGEDLFNKWDSIRREGT